MQKKIGFAVLLFFSLKIIAQNEPQNDAPKYAVTFGTGYAFQYFNKMQQPSERGTPLRLDKFSTSAPVAFRLQMSYFDHKNTEYRVLFSPFLQKGTFTPAQKVLSQSTEFGANEAIKTRFGFNVFRVGFARKKTSGFFKNFKIGATLVVRKWEIHLQSATKKSDNDNLLALPILYLGYEKNIGRKLFLTADFDGIAIPSAYVVEGGGALNYQLHKNLRAGLQYRLLSGFFEDGDIKNAFTTQNLGIALTAQF
jgi:hypothetical protein